MAEDTNQTKKSAQDGLYSTIDELRSRLNSLVDEALGQNPKEKGEAPEKAASDNIDSLVKNAPPGLLIEWIKRMASDPDIVEMTKPNTSPEAMPK